MARATLSVTLAALFLGACLAVSSGVVSAANSCKKGCKSQLAACIAGIKATKTACLAAAGDKPAKKACKQAFATNKKAAKAVCKTGCPTPDTAPPSPTPCSPSGAFLDSSSF